MSILMETAKQKKVNFGDKNMKIKKNIRVVNRSERVTTVTILDSRQGAILVV